MENGGVCAYSLGQQGAATNQRKTGKTGLIWPIFGGLRFNVAGLESRGADEETSKREPKQDTK